VRRRLVLERDLREALEKGQLSLRYQPKVDLASWAVTGFEALLRWQHPEHGEVPPGEFVAVAEESGLILALGEWALQQACAQAAQWPAHLSVAVNISPVQVMTHDLPEVVQRALKASGLAARRLELEITESVFINETRGTVGRLHALRGLGVQIALDDFGTGYSSLAYLRRFPFDTLKIDRAFVRELLVSRDARAIVRNILALAGSLRMATVAEGVEEPAQVAVLADEGCAQVQGYYVARPLPADEVLGFVAQWQRRAGHRPATPVALADTDLADPVLALAEH
jgi:EAL domain-containing protein (putative c-di-GMP-specific phosphodiesterase class I)